VDIAIRSALTGHLIFSTLHTNDAISSVGRMVDMGAEPYLIASVLEGLLAQRLGRRVCRHCAAKVPLDDDRRARITEAEAKVFDGLCTIGRGCDECNGSGYRGRLGFFELARINPRLRAAISRGDSVLELRNHVEADFMTMRADGIAKAAQGITTIEEVLRATQDVEDNGG